MSHHHLVSQQQQHEHDQQQHEQQHEQQQQMDEGQQDTTIDEPQDLTPAQVVKSSKNKYSAGLNTGQVWYLNGGKLFGSQMVRFSNAI